MMKLDQVSPRELVQCPVAAHSRIDLGVFFFLFSVEDLSAFLFGRRSQLRAMKYEESYSTCITEAALGEIRCGTNFSPPREASSIFWRSAIGRSERRSTARSAASPSNSVSRFPGRQRSPTPGRGRGEEQGADIKNYSKVALTTVSTGGFSLYLCGLERALGSRLLNRLNQS
mmetsp:Transcript_78140/g.252662  ORF Transcript_78140/g.252662 Transcript_78140/m.252662 type:complete len:172 (-) Transcript_78140:49-564(-)